MSTVSNLPAASKSLVRAAALSFVAKAAEKDADRDALPDGSEFNVQATLLVEVDGEEFRHDLDGRLSVGHPSQRAGTVDAAEVIAYILSHVDKEVRAKVLEDSVSTFAENDCTFPVDKATYEQCKAALSAMRARNQTVARGSVSVKLNNPQPALRLVR